MMKILGLFALSSSFAFGKSLKFEEIQHSQITVSPDLVGIYVDGDQVFETPYNSNYLIQSSYLENPKKGEFPFGNSESDTAGTIRREFPKGIKKGYWYGISSFQHHLLMMEGLKKKVALYNRKKQKFSLYSDIILDLYKPAADSRGEPTKREVSESRSKFSKSLGTLKYNDIALTGLTAAPMSWMSKNEGITHFVSTTIPGFPLFAMSCDLKDGLLCRFKRHCFVEGLNGVALGVAISEKRKKVLFIDKSRRQINVFSWKSCHHLAYLGKLTLPKKLFNARGIHVDASDNLWVSTERPDNYKNASVYKWRSIHWGLK